MGRAIIRNPQAFLMDEPLSNLDAKLRVQMRTEVARIQKRLGTTMVYVTHDQTEAMTLGDRVAVMRAGRVEQIGSPQELYREPLTEFVARFIGGHNILKGTVDGTDGDRTIQRATRDDSVVQGLIDAGKITEAEARVHPLRNRINNGIGLFPPNQFRATVRPMGDVRDLDYLLLCSDGLHGIVEDREIAQLVYGSPDAGSGATALLDRARKGGAPDNVSVVLARVLPEQTARGQTDRGAGGWRARRRSHISG